MPGGRPPTTHGSLSWHVLEGHAYGVDLSDQRVVMSLRYFDAVQPSTKWEVVLYVDERGDAAQRAALADIFLGGRAAPWRTSTGPRSPRSSRCDRRASASSTSRPRKRIDVVGYVTVEAEGAASDTGDVLRYPGFDHPGTEFAGRELRSVDPALRWEIRGRRHASFGTDFEYCGA